jgi:hypothetical protein
LPHNLITMRAVAEIPHAQLKITIFQWNGKYVIKIEIGQFEQTYKVGEMDVEGLEGVKKLLNDDFLESVMERFLEMREDFHRTYNRSQG